MAPDPGPGVGDPIPLTEVERDAWYPLDLTVARIEIFREGWRHSVSSSGGSLHDQLPAAAIAAMERGASGGELEVLAGMDGAGWTELEDRLARVYAERGVAPPSGPRAWALSTNALLRTIAESPDAAWGAKAIYFLTNYGPDEVGRVVHDAGDYWISIDLAEQGILASTPSELRAEFQSTCAAILRAGGVPGS